jgi:tetratricopeptide (TPR) repeat protein
MHRDLKPANIMTTPQRHAKILDFGLARLSETEANGLNGGDTTGRYVVGTPPYIPPEHLRGDPVDARGDIYSLGVTLFEMLTGRRPFEAREGASLVTAVLSSPTPRPRSFLHDIPVGLDAIVFRAMAREPADRYGSAAELESDLRQLASTIIDAPTRSHVRLPIGGWTRRRLGGWSVVAAVAVAAGVYGASGSARFTPASAPRRAVGPSVVAVLPVTGVTRDAETDSFAVGVADALITAVARVPGVTVVSRSATLKYRDRSHDLDAVAGELGANLVIDGVLQRSGEALLLTVSIVEPGSNRIRWRRAYEGTFAQVFTLQKEVARAVAAALSVDAAPAEPAHRSPTANVDAFAEYAQARSFLERPDVRENLDRSIVLFQSALAKDPALVRAHAGLGEAYWRKFESTRNEEWTNRARDEILEALRLDPSDTSVRLALATMYRGLGRLGPAIEELRRITEVQPASDEARRLLGQCLIDQGDHAAGIAEIEEATRIRPQYWAHHAALGLAYYKAGLFTEALVPFRRVTQLQPDSAWGYQMLGAAFHSMDDTANAIAPYERAVELGNAKAHGNLGLVYSDMGRLNEALRHWEASVRLDPSSPLAHHNVATALDRLGRAREARAAYRRAADLCRRELSVNPSRAPTLALLALVESKLDMQKEADEHIRRAVQLAGDDQDVRYSEAIIHTRAGRLDQGLASLSLALAAGYPPRRAQKARDLEPLRALPAFAESVSARLKTRGPA